MHRLFLLLLPLLLFSGCKRKKPVISGDDPVEITDFIEAFPPVKLSFMMSDTGIVKKSPDSMLISKTILKQFVPDSIYAKEFPKGTTPKFYMLGREAVKGGETYLFMKAATPAKSVGYVLCYDKDDVFKAAMPFVFSSTDRRIIYEGGMDHRHTVTRNRIRKLADGQTYNKDVYVYNSAGTFTLILNESNEAVEEAEVYNPIDTLARKFSRSGDYVKSKKNFISFRDGSKTSQLLFFIHFEENEGACTGELRGIADMVKPNIALYRRSDDHCELEFTFTKTGVKVRELEGCGNHRGVKCNFDADYKKKKEAKKPKPKS